MIDVFISYKQEERERMRPIAEGLRALGVDVWFDERLQPDRPFTEEINNMVRSCRAQLVCWSPAAVKSAWVVGEAEIGRARRVLVAAMLKRCELSPPFNVFHAEDLTEWRGDGGHNGWRKVLVALGAKLGRPGLAELNDTLRAADAATLRAWLRKYPSDPFARQAADRAAALEADEAPSVRRTPPREHWKPETPWRTRALIAGGAAVLALGAFGAVALSPRSPNHIPTAGSGNSPLERSVKTQVEPDRASGPAAPRNRLEAATTPSSTVAGGEAERLQASVRNTPSTPVNTGSTVTFLRRLTTAQWLTTPSQDLLERALAASSREALVTAAETEPRAQTLVGAGYLYGAAGFTREPQTAARFLTSAAERGDAQAQGLLGSMYANGRGVARNDTEAVRLLRLAADQGYVGAQYNLGMMYTNGRGAAPDHAQALRYFVQAANHGHAEAQARSASMYERGLGTEADAAEAVRYYRLAAAQGHAMAQNNLGFLYEVGRGVARDYDEAVALYRRSAQQNNADGQNNLGQMYKAGFGVARDHVEAVRYFRLAADQGNAAGRYNLGVMFMNGLGGLSRDTEEADRLIRLSAAQGYWPARQAVDAAGVRRDLD